jgi:uncharacterized protein YcaQ
MSADAARRLVLASSGFAAGRSSAQPDVRHFRRVMRQLELIQLDSVNVSARTHYWVFFARLGDYDRDKLDHWLWRSGEHFEYWAHEASILPQSMFRLLEYRMRAANPEGRAATLMSEHPGYLEAVLEEVRRRGPLTVGSLSDPGERTGPWWGYGRGKIALEWHFRTGDVTVADRPNFHRLYDITDRVIPAHHRSEHVERDDAIAALLERSARALGVGTLADIADYYRIRMPDARRLFPRVLQSGSVFEVEVDGWGEQAFRHVEAGIPRSVEGSALISPFDPLIWFRERALRVFDLHYRIEIYVPKEQRIHGYYVLPFLMDGDIAARVDLKTDRNARLLTIRSAHLEPGRPRDVVARRLAEHLESTAKWLGCDSLTVEGQGDLSSALVAALA